MKSTNIININQNKVYTEEELQKYSPIPLFEDSYIGENPNNVDVYIRYNKSKNIDETQYIKLEKKYVQLLPPYILAFSPRILIGEDDNVIVDFELTDAFLRAMQITHGLKEKPSNEQITQCLKKDLSEFYKQFNAHKLLLNL